MKTIKNMWWMSKFASVMTLLLCVGALVALGQMWVSPFDFGYPPVVLLVNVLVTAWVYFMVKLTAKIVNDEAAYRREQLAREQKG